MRLTPVIGADYSYAAVRDFYMPDATALHYVIIKNDEIVALRLREDYNPNIFNKPGEVCVGAYGKVKERGDELGGRTKRVPLFVKRMGKRVYTFLGNYNVIPRAVTAAQLKNAQEKMQKVHTQGVSRIVYLAATAAP